MAWEADAARLELQNIHPAAILIICSSNNTMPLTSDQYSNDEFTINPGVLLPYLRAVNGLFTTYYYLLRRDMFYKFYLRENV